MSRPESRTRIDIQAWIDRAKADPHDYLERQATEVLLTAVGQSERFGEGLYLKGGILMGVVYGSSRQTVDIDFTAGFDPDDATEQALAAALNTELRRVPARLGYPQLVCRIQTIKRQPRRDRFVTASFPALDLTIAYAERDSPAHARLERGQCPEVLHMEISFREPVYAVEFVRLHPDSAAAVGVYSLVDVLAEKLRALLQQVVRERNRRQDVYDIDFLVREVPLDSDDKSAVLQALFSKARARGIEPHVDAMDDPEVRRRAEAEWGTLAIEVGTLPSFQATFANVVCFYRSLPW